MVLFLFYLFIFFLIIWSFDLPCYISGKNLPCIWCFGSSVPVSCTCT